MKKYLWLAVSVDEYELPLMVADTAEELGKAYGLGKNAVCDAVIKGNSGRISGRKFVKVSVSDSCNDEQYTNL